MSMLYISRTWWKPVRWYYLRGNTKRENEPHKNTPICMVCLYEQETTNKQPKQKANNQMKIHLTMLNGIFGHIQQILSCGIFCLHILRMLEAFDGFLNHNCLFWTKKSLQTEYFAQQMGMGTNTIKLI